MIKKYRFPSFW